MRGNTTRFGLPLQATAFLLCLLLPLSAAFARQQQAGLVGTWQCTEDGSLILKLGGDGTGALNADRFKYAVRGDQLLVEDGTGETRAYTFKLEGDALTVSGGNLPHAFTFRRQGGGLFEKNLGGGGREGRDEAAPDSPAGTWERRDGTRTARLVLRPDGTGSLDGERFRWTYSQGTLSLSEGNSTLSFAASFDSRTLKLTRPGDARTLVFERAGGTTGSGGAGGSGGEARREGEGAGASRGGGLTGRWRSDAATVEIFDNGTLTVNGERFRYAVEGDTITLTNEEGAARVRFQLSGDTLVTEFNGRRDVYRRAGDVGEAPRGGGANPPELVGKWCYMASLNNSSGGRMTNRCFTLYENGTYDYYGETSTSTQYGGTASQDSDGGTWSVAGGTLTAHSRKHGVLTFPLQKRNHPKTGDPMLVLDGDAFVTYSPRAPWP